MAGPKKTWWISCVPVFKAPKKGHLDVLGLSQVASSPCNLQPLLWWVTTGAKRIVLPKDHPPQGMGFARGHPTSFPQAEKPRLGGGQGGRGAADPGAPPRRGAESWVRREVCPLAMCVCLCARVRVCVFEVFLCFCFLKPEVLK